MEKEKFAGGRGRGHSKVRVVLRIRDTIFFSKLLYPSIRVRTAPPVSVRVSVSVSFSFTEID